MSTGVDIRFLKIGVAVSGLIMFIGIMILGGGIWFAARDMSRDSSVSPFSECNGGDLILPHSAKRIISAIPYEPVNGGVIIVFDDSIMVVDLCHNTIEKRLLFSENLDHEVSSR